MTKWEIINIIYEIGWTSVKDVAAYFKRKHPKADINIVKIETKKLIAEAKKYSKRR